MRMNKKSAIFTILCLTLVIVSTGAFVGVNTADTDVEPSLTFTHIESKNEDMTVEAGDPLIVKVKAAKMPNTIHINDSDGRWNGDDEIAAKSVNPTRAETTDIVEFELSYADLRSAKDGSGGDDLKLYATSKKARDTGAIDEIKKNPLLSIEGAVNFLQEKRIRTVFIKPLRKK